MGDETPILDVKEPKSKVQEYTGKITDIPAPADEKYEEPVFAKEPRSSEIFGDNTYPLATDNRELQDLHIRPVNDAIDSQSISTRQSTTDRPAAGAGGSSTYPIVPCSRGRRHVRKTIFEDEGRNEYGLAIGPAAGLGPQVDHTTAENQEIFSIKGTRSIKINRHRDTVNVFPSGCMGIPQDAAPTPGLPLPKIPEDHLPAIDLNQSPIKDEYSSSVESTPRTPSDDHDVHDVHGSPKKNSGVSDEESPAQSPRTVQPNFSNNSVAAYRRSRPLSAVQRNPLTGVGYEDRDFIRQSNIKKRDGNPVLGQGYETKDLNKSKKIPPGGYSRGLW